MSNALGGIAGHSEQEVILMDTVSPTAGPCWHRYRYSTDKAVSTGYVFETGPWKKEGSWVEKKCIAMMSIAESSI